MGKKEDALHTLNDALALNPPESMRQAIEKAKEELQKRWARDCLAALAM